MAGALSAGTDPATDFRTHHHRLGNDRPAWLRDLRHRALERFESAGFPSSRSEAWKHTSVAPIAGTEFTPPLERPDDPDLAREALASLPDPGGPAMVFVNGRFAPSISSIGSLPGGILAGNLDTWLREPPVPLREYFGRYASEENPFTALNTALHDDGAAIFLPDHTVLEATLHLVFLTIGSDAPVACHPRTLIVCGRESRLSVMESYAGLGRTGRCLTNAVTEIDLAEGSEVVHCRLQREPDDAYHVGRLTARQDRSSRLTTTSLALGAALARLDLGVRLAGEGAEANLYGLYLTGGNRHADQHTEIDHAVPHCSSNEVFRGILAGRSSAVFDGTVKVRPHAVGTNANQANQNLLLSDEATVHTRPRLEIHADDVRCTHGATIGRLDSEALFYLRARGIGERQAREILVAAFAGDILDHVGIEPLREALNREIASRIEDRS